MDKNTIRKRCLSVRQAMPAQDVTGKSAAIVERLKSLRAFSMARNVLTYVSSKDNEVDTHALIEWLIANHTCVYVPAAQPDKLLAWSRIESLGQLAPARFGILEPIEGLPRSTVPPEDSVAIVPGIAFTRDCRRIGYGGGFYDRFLAAYPGPSIALAFDLQIVDHIDSDPHDIPVDFIVTETQVYCKPIP